jgi:hypothetical protein
MYSKLASLLLCLLLTGCSQNNPPVPIKKVMSKATWTETEKAAVAEFNANLEPGKYTLDVGVYFPSNFDSSFKKVTLESMMIGLKAAKEIYATTGVQIHLKWIKTGEIDPSYLSIQANEVPGIPNTGYINLYEHSKRHPAELTEHAKEAFEHIIEVEENSDRTIYFVALQDVFYPFLTVAEGRNWMMKTVRTGGLSFPSYSYSGTIPRAYRGVISISNLERPDRQRRTIAHEIGHKVMNVSHEYMEISPEHEVYADGGLMVYGSGEEIPSGKEGRWHQERLLLSPYLYILGEDGSKKWNPDYLETGHYYDPIYGDYVIQFDGTPAIEEDW